MDHLNKFLTARTLPVLIGGLVILTLAMALVFTWIAYRSVTLGTAPGVVLHPRRIETPFTLGIEIKPTEFAAIMKLPLYPGSVADESTVSRWFPAPRPKSGKGVGLALLRLRAEVRPAQAEGWYKDHLGSDFVRTQGNLVGAAQGRADWLCRVSKNPDANSVLFLRSQPASEDGVLLEPDQASERVLLITIFRYSGSQSK
jgi:hypothetical protein